MADNFKTGSDAETFKVESDVESSSGDSDYCPSNDGSYIESSPRPKPPRRSRKRTAKEAESRTLMRQWLLDLIDEGGIPELYWIDNDRTLVHIPWLHASRHTFDTAKDSTLFKLWAVHSGKYVPDEDTPDPKRWKANFRCAINSLSDVHEVKDQSCKKGHDAYKVYRFDADKRLAKKSSLSANERTMSNDVLPPSEKKVCKRPVLNADRRALMNAKKMNRMNQLSEPAIPTTRANEPAITMTRANEPAITMTRANEPAITMTRANEPAITMTRANEPAITMTRANEPAITRTRANEPAIPTTRANEPAIPTTRANEPAIAMPGAYVPFTATTLVLEPAIATTQTSTLATDIINWLKQQNCMQYGDMCNDTSSCKFSGMTAKNEVKPVVKYEGPGFYRSTAAVGRGDQGYAYAKNVTTGVTNSAAIPQMVEEYSSSTAIPQHTTYDSSLSPYSLDVCNSPTGTDSSIDSALTDDSIAEMIDEWQAEPKSETDGKWFMQLTSVNILCTPEDNYSFRDVPAQAGLRHPL